LGFGLGDGVTVDVGQTLTVNPITAMVMTHTHAKAQGQRG